MRAREYLDIYKGYGWRIPESELGSGKTFRVRFSEAKGGNPATVALIGSLEKTAGASASAYAIAFTPTEFVAALASLVGKTVYAHLSDGAVWRDTFPFLVTDTDPDLLPPLL